jgi:hypothetical protein
MGIALYFGSQEEDGVDADGEPSGAQKLKDFFRHPLHSVSSQLALGEIFTNKKRNATTSEDSIDKMWEERQVRRQKEAAAAAAAGAGTAAVGATGTGTGGSSGRNSVVAVPLTGSSGEEEEEAVCFDIASLGRRFLAGAVDMLVVQSLLFLSCEGLVRLHPEAAQLVRAQLVYGSRLAVAVQVLYEALVLYATDGKTIGKTLFHLRTRRNDFREVSSTITVGDNASRACGGGAARMQHHRSPDR